MRHRTVAILLALTTLVPLAVAPVVAWAKGPTTASKVRGRWTDPVGACAGHVVSLDPATGAIVCTGTSRWTGTWNGSTKWTLTRILDPSSAAVSGRIDGQGEDWNAPGDLVDLEVDESLEGPTRGVGKADGQ